MRSVTVAVLFIGVACNRAPSGPAVEPLTNRAGHDISMSPSAMETPVSTDVNELARVALNAAIAASQNHREIRRGLGVCNGAPGIEP